MRNDAKVRSAAVRHAVSPVTTESRVNRSSAWPWAIEEYHGGVIVTAG